MNELWPLHSIPIWAIPLPVNLACINAFARKITTSICSPHQTKPVKDVQGMKTLLPAYVANIKGFYWLKIQGMNREPSITNQYEYSSGRTDKSVFFSPFCSVFQTCGRVGSIPEWRKVEQCTPNTHIEYSQEKDDIHPIWPLPVAPGDDTNNK